IDWATGKTTKVPPFFAKPIELEDGRGNIQLLALVRTALSPPFAWRLICFDEAWPAMAYAANPPGTLIEEALAQANDWIADSVEHEKKMAAPLVEQRAKLAPEAKVVAIC